MPPGRALRARAPPRRAIAFWIAKPSASARLRQHEDVVGADLEDALDEAVRRPVGEDEHRQVWILADRALEQVEDAVRVALAGDDEHVAVGALERPGCGVEALDDADDVDFAILRQRAERPGLGQAGVEHDEGANRARHATPAPLRGALPVTRTFGRPSRGAFRLHFQILVATSAVAPSCYRRFRCHV